ncbi:bifunctional diaminohydroxyphosphoribosylaminopyrimidine deaminase/5-amino-6-(5-phosphoribosylamino)uracil reductase RibD [Bacillus toyonensis]|uniref:bifunctional diaminohydroxyphosphoribosylaminopyrimidine deaminase/5-amino-6-(5-phosphoribosylamino)uracil reductase RibD n=1 Tax=Bacillus toyonensis TaxID=155322 RepID=UPI00234EAC03|nr:bifunctional diaminohydroxyphosphoribosylaminopyrimidine deaminase/5-amino-6-(5-phosphoribosylamino)uracil reductase RibD [Bacillus toyonensis]MEC2393471.1 bifunctional diaminohydroxyphosphoribosylaminopyrimidine deaminase/5-amino-6-(5-phosphoribosylamino)uracil reductase RibD [Bacillus toyonensis]
MVNSEEIHEFYMNLALQNAKAMKGQTYPNPLVGAVIVNNNSIVGIGAHLKAGESHAEIHAIKMAKGKTQGATIYVTLEPCSHQGKTGPCALAIIEAGIKRVVIATLDPNPIVSGNGIKVLQNEGIEVIVGVCEEEAIKMNEVFNKYIVNKIPFVTLKSGITLDGKIATFSSNSKWITSEEAREDVHRLRNENAAILVGVNTVIKDNPELTTRILGGRNPIRIILDSTLKIPLDSKVVTDKKSETWIFTSQAYSPKKKSALEKLLNIKIFITEGESRVELKEVLRILGEHFIASLLIEGGGEVNASFIENKLVDKFIIYIAPKIIGGRDAPTFIEGNGIGEMKDAIEFSNLTFKRIGKDFKMTGYPSYNVL